MQPDLGPRIVWGMEKIVLGLMGVKQSGKSTVGQILAEDHGFAILEPGRQVMELLLDIDPIMEEEPDFAIRRKDGSFVNTLRASHVYEDEGYEGFKARPEGRRLLQQLGTQIRERDPYFWVTLQLRAIESTDGHIVNTSVRFPNEAALVRGWEAGGLWLIERDSAEDTMEHVSETAWRDLAPDKIIENNGTESDLRRTVSEAIKELG